MNQRHYHQDINESYINRTCHVMGWVSRCRDHGGVVFIDLRDETGMVQLVASPDYVDVFNTAQKLRSEYVIAASGRCRARPEGTINEQIASGQVDIELTSLSILNESQHLPFLPDDNDATEETRLRYRIVDLRRSDMQRNLRLRHTLTTATRQWLNNHRFVDIETPLLTCATPEGARDFLVPSRLQKGHFYALPQSPQLFKQMLVAGGFERYYQIAHCFRDEDLRADRQPEFTQIDIEMAFVNEEQIKTMMEEMIINVFTAADITLPNPFPQLSYQNAMQRFGCDCPDLRNPLELVDLTTLATTESFAVFANAANMENGRVAALKLPNGAKLTRKEIDDLTLFVSHHGAKGLAYIKCQDIANEQLQSPIVKFLSPNFVRQLLSKTQAKDGDILFFGADNQTIVNAALSALRNRLAEQQQLFANDNHWQPVWIVDFPMFEHNGQRWQSCHHPFTAMANYDNEDNITPNSNCRARAYDLVINGVEVGGGSIRIHQVKQQLAVLKALGINEQQAYQQFGFLLSTLSSGAPPHGGIAFGLDRIVAMITGATSLRDVIAFPKTQRGQCLLTEAPTPVDDQQLTTLGLSVPKNYSCPKKYE